MIIRKYQAYELPHYVTLTWLCDLSFHRAGENTGLWRRKPRTGRHAFREVPTARSASLTSQQRNSLLPSCMDPAILFSFSWKRCQAVWALLVRSPLRCLSSFKPFTRSGAHLSATTNWRLKKKRRKKKKIRRKLEDETDLQMKQVAFSFACSCHHEYWNCGLSWPNVYCRFGYSI
jgi:hypothetical protein